MNTSPSYSPRRWRPETQGSVALSLNESRDAGRKLEFCGLMVRNKREEEVSDCDVT